MMEWFGRMLQNHLRRLSVVWSYMRMYVSREMHILDRGGEGGWEMEEWGGDYSYREEGFLVPAIRAESRKALEA